VGKQLTKIGRPIQLHRRQVTRSKCWWFSRRHQIRLNWTPDCMTTHLCSSKVGWSMTSGAYPAGRS